MGRRVVQGRWIALCCVTVLAGCFGGAELPKINPEKGALFSGSKSASKDLMQKVSVLSGQAAVTAPKGFCVDKPAVQDGAGGAFVPMGACSALTGNPNDPTPKTPAFLTVAFLPIDAQQAGLPDDPADRLAVARAYLESDAGRAGLSWSGSAADLSISSVRLAGDVLRVKVQDRSAGLPSGLSETSWRAFFELGGAVVTASVTGVKGHKLSNGQAEALLKQLVSDTRSANPKAKSGGSGIGKLFGRLRN